MNVLSHPVVVKMNGMEQICYWNLHFWSNGSCDTIVHHQATDPLFWSRDSRRLGSQKVYHAVYLHLRETGHTINIKEATILDREEHYNRRH